tara:strand:- start:964 stop:1854 length:891 start_codon:yes stop_codon:yes gene_type:complete
MKKVIITKGLPASGKSTYAKNLVKENVGMWKRVNKDDMRDMFDASVHSKGNEKFLLRMRDHVILEALRSGKHVIIDDTNFEPRHEERIREIVAEYKAESGHEVNVEVKFFDVNLEECIKRDKKRDNPVGEKVIRSIYNKFLRAKSSIHKDPVYTEQDESLPKAIICDLDGTLCLLNGRSPYSGMGCIDDIPNSPVVKIIEKFQKDGHKIIFFSGRTDDSKEQTEAWLDKHGINYELLVMRAAKDQRKDAILKREMFDQNIAGKFQVDFVLDDRNQVVDMWRLDLGLACLQVYYGDF